MSEAIVKKVAQIERRLDNLVFPEAGAGGVLPAVAAAGYALVSDGVNSWAADQAPAWTGEHSFAAGIAFTGASGANEITVPDNIAIALELLDTGGLEYMRIVSTDANPYVLFDPAAAGIKVGIGCNPAYKLEVYDNAPGGYVAKFLNDGDNINRYGIIIQCGHDDWEAIGTTYYLAAMDGDASNITGYLQTVNGVFQLADVSDASRKINIVDTKLNGLDIIRRLQVRDYNWKGHPDGPMMTSFVAQEAQEVYPAMIGKASDGTLMTARTMLIPIITKAIQELDARLTQGEL